MSEKKVRLKSVESWQLFHPIMNAATLITRCSNNGSKQRIKGNHTWMIYPRAQLPPAAGLHPAEAVLLPGLWGDPGAAPQHVQEDVPPVDAWVPMLWRSRRVALRLHSWVFYRRPPQGVQKDIKEGQRCASPLPSVLRCIFSAGFLLVSFLNESHSGSDQMAPLTKPLTVTPCETFLSETHKQGI